ncbi:hypothetical protein K474DRAFT_1559135, partial [Panus rudis PR-1116 ss-1]
SHSPQSGQFDISPNAGDPYDSFDYPHENVAHFPPTPSYHGSYHNSPYSVLSDLPPTFDNEPDSLGLLGDNPSGITITEEYDPSEYDAPNSSGNILNFPDSYMHSVDHHHVSVSVTPPTFDHQSPHQFDHSSPASSNGIEDGRRSRASSTSSYMHPNSPRLDLPRNFEGLRFDSPQWQPGTLADRHSPPQQKPPSPPQLVIPDTTSPPATSPPPIINAPEGDGMGSGPQLHIVPATPVSGGGGTVANVPFQTTLAN